MANNIEQWLHHTHLKIISVYIQKEISTDNFLPRIYGRPGSIIFGVSVYIYQTHIQILLPQILLKKI